MKKDTKTILNNTTTDPNKILPMKYNWARTHYKAGVANGSSDFSAEHTLFLTGGTDWQVTDKFSLQQFYSDYFFSNAPTSDGGFISMGRIQSFNGPTNKLVLVKWKN